MIYFVRHGETSFNTHYLMSGNSNVPLNEKGKGQAIEAGLQLKDVTIDQAYCSSLSRAVDTASSILGFHQNVPLNVDERLCERDFGYAEGCQIRFYPELLGRWLPDFDCETMHCETLAHLFARVKSLLLDIRESAKTKNILLVAHSGIARVLCALRDGKDETQSLEPYCFGNCSIIPFRYEDLYKQ